MPSKILAFFLLAKRICLLMRRLRYKLFYGFTFIGKFRASGQGGGVGTYISSSLPFHRRLDLKQEDIKCIWLEILFPKTKGFVIGIIYHPPDSNCKFDSMLSTVSSKNTELI